jgi:LPXTG-motif cell wall-anchored protein
VPVVVNLLTKALTDLAKFLVTLLTQGLSSLLAMPLVQVNTGALSVITKAVSAVPDSVAGVTGQQPTLKVAGQVVPGLDLTSLLSTLQSTLSGLLKTISPNLAGLVSLTLLNPSHSVTSANGYTDALSRVSELALTIDPAKITGGVTQTIATLANGGPSVDKVVKDLTKTSLQLPNPLAALTSLLGSGVDLLAKPTTLSLAQVTSESKFAVIPTVAPPAALPAKPAVLPAQLPRTGENSTPFIAGAAVLILLSLGAWRLRRRVSEN